MSDAVGSPPSRTWGQTSRLRFVVAMAITILVLATAVITGLLSPAASAPVIAVDRASTAITNALSPLGNRVWWVYAFVAGVVAAFNPCGFALLPAYLGLYLNTNDGAGTSVYRVLHSLRVSAAVAIGFAALFGLAAALFTLASSLISRWLPWLGLGVGVVLILLGGAILAGKPVESSLPGRLAGRFGGRAGRKGAPGYAAFGVAYGLASVGCTLPLFLALMGTALESGAHWSPVLAFILYAAGMAATLGSISVAASLLSIGWLGRVRGVTRFVSAASAVLVLLSGAYVVYYWLTAGRLLLEA
jgi:cytochrome c-type biogenesis protein